MEGIAGAEYKLDGERVQIHKGKNNRKDKVKDKIGISNDGAKVDTFFQAA